MSRKTLLLLGANGYLGRNLVETAKASEAVEKVVCFVRKLPEELGFDEKPILLQDWASFLESHDLSSSFVIDSIGLASLARCEEQKELCWESNCHIHVALAELANAKGVPYFFISSDGLFFDQRRPLPQYSSSSEEPTPNNEYSRAKAACESRLSEFDSAISLRCSFVAPPLGTQKGLLSFLYEAHRARRGSAIGYEDQFFNPVLVGHILEAALKILSQTETRKKVYHLAGDRAQSKHQFLSDVLRLSSLNARIELLPGKRPGGVPSPQDQSLCSDFEFSTDEVVRVCADALSEMVTKSG